MTGVRGSEGSSEGDWGVVRTGEWWVEESSKGVVK